MKTLMLLAAKYETPAIQLEVIREEFLGIKTKLEADRKASNFDLPIPVFKLGTSRSPYMVHLQDLADYIDKQAAAARVELSRIHAA